jgi:hypothetical protein
MISLSRLGGIVLPLKLPPALPYRGAGLVAINSSNVRLGTWGRWRSGWLGGAVRSIALSLLLPGWLFMLILDGLLPVIAAFGPNAEYGYPRLSGDDPAWRRFLSPDEALLSAGTVPPAVRRKSSHVTSSASRGYCGGGGGRRDEESSLIPIRCDLVSRACPNILLYKDCFLHCD